MKQLDELLEEWRKDSEIDRTEPGKELIKIPTLHSKYLNILSRHRLLCQSILKELNSRTFQLRDFIAWERFIQGV